MAFWDDNRGQAIQVGAVLLFAILVIAFSLHQAFVVPAQNEKVEYNHNAEVQNDLQDLRNGIHGVVGGNPGSGDSIQLGTTYPSRLIALNPPPPSGRLRTVSTRNSQVNMTIVNATASGETGDVWNGSARQYNTGGLRYVPDYNEYRSPPETVYENSVLYNQFSDESLVIADQSLISGDRISLVTVNGSFDRSGAHTMTVEPDAISSSERTISVTDGSGPITLNITTQLPPEKWRSLLRDEHNVRTADIRLAPDTDAVSDPFQRVLIPLNRSEEYTLRMTKVGVGTRTSEEKATYLTDVSLADSTVTRGENTTVVVEVRDAYNNPQAGVPIDGYTENGSITPSVGTTDTDGRVAFTYNSSGVSDGLQDLQFSLDSASSGFDASTGEDVATTVDVKAPPQQGGDGSAGAFNVFWNDPDTISANSGSELTDCTASECTWNVGESDDDTLQLNAETAPVLEEATIDFAATNTSPGSLSPWSKSTDTNGIASTVLTAKANGTIGLVASGSGSGDRLNISVENYTVSTVSARVDDLTDIQSNSPEFVASYDVSNVDSSSFQRVEISAESSNGGDASATNADTRGSVRVSPGYGQGESYDITYEVIYNDGSGEYVETSETITTDADSYNPMAQNADLSTPASPTLDGYTITDRTKTNQNTVRYRYEYTIGGGNANFQQVELLAINRNGNGNSQTAIADAYPSPSGPSHVDIEFNDGANTMYKLGLLVYDDSGAVVSDQILDDEADKADP